MKNNLLMSMFFSGLLFAGTALPLSAGEDDFLKPVGKPPAAKAQRRQGGEAMPPLPLPATPLRRSEKKRPPSPTALIGKVVWGGYIDYTWENGLSSRVFDWNMVPADCQQLLRVVKNYMKLEYKTQTVDLATFSGAPSEIPILYFSGGRSLKFTPEERGKLRQYLLDGGMIWFDSIVGSPFFYRSALEEIHKILPEAPIKRLEPDHPVFRMVIPVNSAKTNTGQTIEPAMDGVYIGSRLAAIISPYGMGCGWDNAEPSLITDAKTYQNRTALELGVNLTAYSIGWFENGMAYASGEAYSEKDKVASPDKIIFAQVKTGGIWNSDPGAESKFMRYLAKNVNIDAGTQPAYINPASMPLEDYPFLYLSGIGAFKLTAQEIERLRTYMDKGGFLLLNNSLGLNEFDGSARQISAILYPNQQLERIPDSDPVFSKGPFKFAQSGFSDAAAAKYPGCSKPLLYGIRDGERYKLIYSPVDIAGGWMGTPRPGSVCYSTETALRLGADLITYFVTH
ncbi:MAG: DUF4159 domain-containing protein [Victivallaceae bacterium]|jgi:hypothetical protein